MICLQFFEGLKDLKKYLKQIISQFSCIFKLFFKLFFENFLSLCPKFSIPNVGAVRPKLRAFSRDETRQQREPQAASKNLYKRAHVLEPRVQQGLR